jgi:2-dehydro-3-deoxygalactonokinase
VSDTDSLAGSRLLAVDWGTSVARAYWLDAAGRILAQRSAPLGVGQITNSDFAGALDSLCGLPADRLPIIACGMIGSRQGWIEAPYLECPLDLASLARGLVSVPRTRLLIVPGAICRDVDGTPDVMRGEETQILGAQIGETPTDARGHVRGAPAGQSQLMVLPGTHSKWAMVGPDGLQRFATFMTGELYAVLREHSILGRLAVSASPTPRQEADISADPGADATPDTSVLVDRAANPAGDAFTRGARHGLRAGASSLAHDLFSVRTLVLTGELAPRGVDDYLSGLLIGAEIAAARGWLSLHGVRAFVAGQVRVIGTEALTKKYLRALALAGVPAEVGPADAAARGLWRIASEARLIT